MVGWLVGVWGPQLTRGQFQDKIQRRTTTVLYLPGKSDHRRSMDGRRWLWQARRRRSCCWCCCCGCGCSPAADDEHNDQEHEELKEMMMVVEAPRTGGAAHALPTPVVGGDRCTRGLRRCGPGRSGVGWRSKTLSSSLLRVRIGDLDTGGRSATAHPSCIQRFPSDFPLVVFAVFAIHSFTFS